MMQNIVIPIFYKIEGNKTYVINTTSRKVYWHKHKPFNVNTNLIAGISVLFVVAMVPAMGNWLATHGLDNLAVSTRILLAFIGVAIGILTFWIGRKKRRFVRFEDFIIKHPEAEEMNNATDIEELLHDVSYRVSVMIFASVGVASIGLVLFALFLNNSNIMVYGWGVLCFAVAGFTSIFYRDIMFLSKLKSIDDITYSHEVGLDEEEDSGELEVIDKNNGVKRGAAEFINWSKLSK